MYYVYRGTNTPTETTRYESVYVDDFTCYVVDRVEADTKPPDFVWVVALAAPPGQLNSFPVILSERSIVVGVESRTFCENKNKKIAQRKSACVTIYGVLFVVAWI